MTEEERELDLQLADALDEIKELRNQIERLKGHIHTCGPTCSKAGCINQRLREERDALRAALAEQLEQAALAAPQATEITSDSWINSHSIKEKNK